MTAIKWLNSFSWIEVLTKYLILAWYCKATGSKTYNFPVFGILFVHN
jgi:hypothetical protein